MNINEIIEENVVVHSLLKDRVTKIEELVRLARLTLDKNGKIILFGNGGSASDAAHIAAEFIGRRVFALTNLSTLTAIANDYEFAEVFSKQLRGICEEKDLVIGLSTSGESENVVRGIAEANRIGANTVALTGKNGGRLARVANLSIIVPSGSTPRIQEVHLLLGHILWECLDTEGKR